jgi:hypothetical protein
MRRLLGFRALVLVCFGSVAAALAAGRATAGAELSPQVGETLQVLITTAKLVVGPNRFAFGLLKEHQLLEDAQAIVRVYALEGQQGHLQTEVPASYTRLEVIEQGNRVHVHPDGTRHVHHEETDVRGIYVAQIPFARPGAWGLEVCSGYVFISCMAYTSIPNKPQVESDDIRTREGDISCAELPQ